MDLPVDLLPLFKPNWPWPVLGELHVVLTWVALALLVLTVLKRFWAVLDGLARPEFYADLNARMFPGEEPLDVRSVRPILFKGLIVLIFYSAILAVITAFVGGAPVILFRIIGFFMYRNR